MSQALIVNVSKQACLACRQRKDRCTGEEPCASCTRRGERCLYVAHRRGGPRRKGVSKPLAADLEVVETDNWPFFVATSAECFPSLSIPTFHDRASQIQPKATTWDICDVQVALVDTLWRFATGDKVQAMNTLKEACDQALASDMYRTNNLSNQQILAELWVNDKVLHAFSGSTTCFLSFAIPWPVEDRYSNLITVADVLRQAALSGTTDDVQHFDEILAELRLRLPRNTDPVMARTRILLDTVCIMIHARRAQIALPFLIQAPACGLVLDPTLDQCQRSMISVERCVAAANDMATVSATSQVTSFQLSCSLALAIVVHANAIIMGWQPSDARVMLQSNLKQLRELARHYSIACRVLERLDTVLHVLD
ncbi:hypothetical protein BCR37DRAFT_375537 [Protomyces lactucae-debilis]|uniref:Zn(2)-C6 fungal-type domain-containing protein n=1 Tax=Protomyces lactucae-debilis TaxID=2754530 RepID=A0A1Y2FWI8_PROLT|nr:uncharacterized protein BCR37DRAFT_375537 [Protomyces lactucae-debilis]ORY87664.1 hypothetical protein BCR37DRAFT_375537 [Protomyces lactucae-debilis]